MSATGTAKRTDRFDVRSGDGTTIAVWVEGDGPPLVMVHGSLQDHTASGALVAGSWVRVVFGPLVAAGNPPPDLDEQIVWITDHSYRLRE